MNVHSDNCIETFKVGKVICKFCQCQVTQYKLNLLMLLQQTCSMHERKKKKQKTLKKEF